MSWSKEEDLVLQNHVKEHGECDWQKVADLLGRNRTANSCFQRWFNQLKPGIDHTDITDDEFIAILQLHKKYGGNKDRIPWSKIAKELSEMRHDNRVRTPTRIKNFWNVRIKNKALELNLERDSEAFLITMTNILRGEIPPTTSIAGGPTPDFGDTNYHWNYNDFSYDHLANGASFTLDDFLQGTNWTI